MTTHLTDEIVRDLRDHQTLCQEVLALTERECQSLRCPDGSIAFDVLQAKRGLLLRLNEWVPKVRRHRLLWQGLTPADRAEASEVTALLRQNQELIMRIIVLDRENEQALLRKGLVPPRHLPPVNRQRPHFVADLYRQQSLGGRSQLQAVVAPADH